MSNRTTSSLSISCSPDEKSNIELLAKELGCRPNRAVHKAVRQSLRAIGHDPDAPKAATKGNHV